MTPEVRAKCNANLKSYKPGQSGNPEGRPKNAGLSVREWVNVMQEFTEAELREVARTNNIPWNKRTAAERMLRTLEHPDMADFHEFIDGDANLLKLRQSGINTETVKKAKVKTRKTVGADGQEVVEVEREIELHDRGLAEFTEIVNQTAGKPRESIEIAATKVGEDSQEAFDILWQRYAVAEQAPPQLPLATEGDPDDHQPPTTG